MGIATGTFQQLLQEHRLRPFAGNLLTLGRQDIYLTVEDVQYWTNYYEVPMATDAVPMLSPKPELAAQRYLSDQSLFELLGLRSQSLDASSYEGCDFVADLNVPEPPPDIRGRFDVVLDTGTFEHVFHLPNAFQFCHALLKEGGRMVHMSPASNFVDHGFYMMSPTLFLDFYEANGWRIRQIKLIRHTRNHNIDPYWVTDYAPDHFQRLSFGGLGEGVYQTFVVAEKLPGATAHRIPQQRVYREFAWGQRAGVTGVQQALTVEDRIAIRIRERLDHYQKWIGALCAVRSDLRIAIFGAGKHTTILLKAWREARLPDPACVFQSSRPAASQCEGIELIGIDELAARPSPQLIVFSSQSYETELAATAARMFPLVPTLRFWT